MTPTSPLMNNASSKNPFYNVILATPFQAGNQTLWGPDSIGTIVFGVIMCILGLVALWQGRQKAKSRGHDVEQGRCGHDLGERTTNAADPVPMVHTSPGMGSESVDSQNGQEQERQQSSTPEGNERAREEGGKGEGSNVQIGEPQGDENNVHEEFKPKRGNTTRTDTDWTLVGTDDGDDAKGKNHQD